MGSGKRERFPLDAILLISHPKSMHSWCKSYLITHLFLCCIRRKYLTLFTFIHLACAELYLLMPMNWHNLLLRCFQGFVSAVGHMRSFVPAIYDVTVAIPKNSPAPTMLRLFKGQPSVVS